MKAGKAKTLPVFIFFLTLQKQFMEDLDFLEKKTEELEFWVQYWKARAEILKANELKYRTLFEISTDGLFLFFNMKFRNCNQRACEIFKCRKEDIINKTPADFSPEFQPDGSLSAELSVAYLAKAFAGESLFFEWQHMAADGSLVDAEVGLHPVIINGKSMLFAIMRDITLHKKQDEKIKILAQELGEVIENVGEGITLSDESGYFSIFNSQMEKITGYSKTEANEAHNFLHLLYPNPEAYYEALRGISETAQNSYREIETVIHTKNAEEKHLLVTSTTLKRDEKSLFLSIYRDITDRVLIEEAAKNQYRFVETLIDTIPNPIFYKDSDGIYLGCNEKFANFLGLKKSEIIGKTVFDISPRHLAEKYFEKDNELLKGKKVEQQYEFQIKNFEGELRDVIFYKALFSKIDEKIGGLVGIILDISDIKKSENLVRKSEERYRSASENNPNGFFIFDAIFENNFLVNFKCVEVNSAACEMLYSSRNELINKNLTEILEISDSERVINYYKKVFLSKRKSEKEWNVKLKKFKPQAVQQTIIQLENGIAVMIRDITERKKAELLRNETERKIITAIIETEERERRRFAEELHDGLAPLLSAIKMYVNLFSSKKMDENEKIKLIKETSSLIDEAIRTASDTANNIMPATLRDFGLIASLRTFCNKIDLIHPKVEFISNFNERLNSKVEIAFFRIVKELINNTLKHAKAQKIHIHLTKRVHRLYLHYEDDGIGFNISEILQSKNFGMGLSNIFSKIESLKGSYKIDNSRNSGFKINILVDLQNID